MAKSIEAKALKKLVVKQIKKNYPNFNSHTKREKKEIIKDIWTQVYNNYDFSTEPELSKQELLNIEPLPQDIITIEQMKKLMAQKQTKIIPLMPNASIKYIQDPELKDIYDIVNWNLINRLLADQHYTPGKRDLQPVHFFRAELLKNLKYAELSYRKYTTNEINNPERKAYRAFIGLKSDQSISHSQLSQFRSALTFKKLLNVMVYFICLFLENKPLSPATFYAMDSTEIAAKTSPYPLFKMKLGDKWIRVYQDIDADVGTRRQKRDKSTFVVGYRLHTLTVIDAQTEIAYPLLSILAPANHHDSNFLELLVDFGKRIGLNLNIVTTDQAYGDRDELEYIHNKHNVIILNAPKELTQLPQNVDAKTYAVRKNSSCSVDMVYAGCDQQYGHEFHCNAQSGDCPFEGSCNKFRYIPVDTGAFGKIPYFLDGAQKIVAMRKVAERPFNLIKHRDGLEPLRTKGIHNSTVVATIANIATLLIEIAGHRKKVKTNNEQHKNLAFEFMKKAA
jgi:hypothetical protein